MAWKHIPDNEEAWLYYQEGLLYHGDPVGDEGLVNYPCPTWWQKSIWLAARFDGTDYRKNYIYLEA